jgi:nitrogen PTS system EIIA component
MRISDYLSTDVVLPALDAAGKDEVTAALAERLAARHADVDGAALATALRERERQVSTALEDGVAIPHARLRGLSRIVAAFGRSRAGIHCGSHDGNPTHFFLLLVVPEEAPGSHLKLLATASRLLHDPGCRTRLMQAVDESALLDVLRAEEARAHAAARAA